MTASIAYFAALGCAIWFAQAALLFLHLARLRDVATADTPDPADWPSVSAVIPARDEAVSLESALRSRLDDDYPALQLIVVDDRSADATPDVINLLAAEDVRVHAVRIDELPAGWLGKPHALACGVRAADGDWLLISDADVQLSPGGLRRAVAYCLSRNLDFLALVPEFRSRSFGVDVVWSVFMRVLGTFVDPAAVRRPESRAAMGSGAFMLARRDVFDRTAGFEHLRLETTDDIALGMMMKQAGGRCDFANGRDIASISIYDDLGAFFRGIEKNAGSLVRAPFAAVL
ncbi:MAG: glycosyltransferase, partial [Actinomycetota bacterium]|nr:glycosyltransferase [Actinomycetota bacterium]